MLAGLPKAPTEDSPFSAFKRARDRQHYVLGQMVENRFITSIQAEDARKESIAIISKDTPLNHIAAPYFVEHVRKIVQARYGGRDLYDRGLRIPDDLSLVAVASPRLAELMQEARRHYDYVVVDTSKSFSPTTLAAFDQSDTVFVVVALDLPSLRNVQRGLPLLKRVLPRGLEQARLIVNRYQPDEEIGLKEVEQTLGLKVFWTLSNDYEAVIRSINQGKPIVLNGSSKYTKDVKALGAKIAGLGGKDRVARPSASRIMGQLVRIVRKTGESEA